MVENVEKNVILTPGSFVSFSFDSKNAAILKNNYFWTIFDRLGTTETDFATHVDQIAIKMAENVDESVILTPGSFDSFYFDSKNTLIFEITIFGTSFGRLGTTETKSPLKWSKMSGKTSFWHRAHSFRFLSIRKIPPFLK